MFKVLRNFIIGLLIGAVVFFSCTSLYIFPRISNGILSALYQRRASKNTGHTPIGTFF